jgi:hypothetical protein
MSVCITVAPNVKLDTFNNIKPSMISVTHSIVTGKERHELTRKAVMSRRNRFEKILWICCKLNNSKWDGVKP